MTTAEQFRDAVSRPASTVPIAGVDWPTYKVVALVLGLLAFAVLIGPATASTAVLTGAATGTATWLVLGFAARSSR
ncbi:hypothetical protein [Mycolicibacterium sp.]|uniref:hypothetical protein n=1 Tax=Mycolicibacterium sp. TaxID=2320850 RepID=UPI003D0CA446